MAGSAQKTNARGNASGQGSNATSGPRAFAEQTLDLIEDFGCQPTPQVYELFFAYAANYPPDVRVAIDHAAGEDRVLRTFDVERIHLEFFRSSQADWELQEHAAELVETSLGHTTQLLDRNLINGKRFDKKFKSASGFMSDEGEHDKMRVFVDSLLMESGEIHRSQLEIATQISMMRDKLVAMQTDLQGARRDSQQDQLTGLGNRRYFDIAIRREVERAAEAGTPLALCLMKVDGFEARVERVGRPVGDALLRLLGTRILETASDKGFPMRFANDEFAVLLPGAHAASAASETDALRSQIAKRNFSIRGSGAEVGTVTLSCAVSMLKSGESAARLLNRTQTLLEDAQLRGGDIVLT